MLENRWTAVEIKLQNLLVVTGLQTVGSDMQLGTVIKLDCSSGCGDRDLDLVGVKPLQEKVCLANPTLQ